MIFFLSFLLQTLYKTQVKELKEEIDERNKETQRKMQELQNEKYVHYVSHMHLSFSILYCLTHEYFESDLTCFNSFRKKPQKCSATPSKWQIHRMLAILTHKAKCGYLYLLWALL